MPRIEASRVIWTTAEWDHIATRAAKLFVEGHAASSTIAFRMANDEMPLNRKRIRTDGNLQPANYKEWKERWPTAVVNAQIAHGAEQDEINQKAHEKRDAENAATIAAITATEQAAAPAPIPLHELPAEKTSDLLAGLLMDIFLKAIESPRGQQALRDAFEVTYTEHVDTVPIRTEHRPTMPSSKPKVKRKQILIVGLLGVQEEEIKKQFGAAFTLKFLTADANSSRMRELAKSSDVSIAMIAYIHHGVSAILKKASKNFHYVNGCVKDLTRVLGSISVG